MTDVLVRIWFIVFFGWLSIVGLVFLGIYNSSVSSQENCKSSNITTASIVAKTSVSTQKPFLPAIDTRVLTEDELRAEIGRYLPSLPEAYWKKGKNYWIEKVKKNYEACAPLPKLDDIIFDNTYWQMLQTSNGTFYLYGAYLDVRKTSALGPTVRVIGFHDRIEPTLVIHCQLWFRGYKKPFMVPNFEYQYIWLKTWGNHRNNVLQPYLMSCILPKQMRHLVPVSVSLVEKPCDHATNNLRVHYDRPTSNIRKNFAVCVKGLDFFHEDLSVRIIEWIEFIRLMGADKIFFYELRVHPNITKVLEYYSKLGVATVTQISLPGGQPNLPGLQHIYLKKNLIHKRQMEIIPYNDCLYRNLYEYRWVVLLDVDEIIVPVKDGNWIELMQRILPLSKPKKGQTPRACYMAHHTYFLDTFRHDWQEDIPPYMHFLQHVNRTHNFTGPRDFVKGFHETDRVLTIHNHFPVACLGGVCSPYWLKTEHARLHHYRKDCVPYILKKCKLISKVIERNTLVWRWRESLIKNVDWTLQSLNFLPPKR